MTTKTLKEILIVEGGFEEFIETENIIEQVKKWLMQKRQEFTQKGFQLIETHLIDELLEELDQ